ncbi:hypothetical protein C8Q76DRAFT_262478 [Earliella scabrosa]|nr:hypothetical protein C8Q76DRAFT_262478 [Earliella scabrosa]
MSWQWQRPAKVLRANSHKIRELTFRRRPFIDTTATAYGGTAHPGSPFASVAGITPRRLPFEAQRSGPQAHPSHLKACTEVESLHSPQRPRAQTTSTAPRPVNLRVATALNPRGADPILLRPAGTPSPTPRDQREPAEGRGSQLRTRMQPLLQPLWSSLDSRA